MKIYASIKICWHQLVWLVLIIAGWCGIIVTLCRERISDFREAQLNFKFTRQIVQRKISKAWLYVAHATDNRFTSRPLNLATMLTLRTNRPFFR